MTGKEFRAIRERLKLSKEDFAEELGFRGTSRGERIKKYEGGKEMVPPWIARLAFLLLEHNLAEPDCLPEWPEWPLYREGGPWEASDQARRAKR